MRFTRKIFYGLILTTFFTTILNGCIKDDIVLDQVDPIIRIVNPIDTIGIDTTYLFVARFLDNTGQQASVETIWSSSDTSIIFVDNNGLAEAKDTGSVTITVSSISDPIATETITVVVGQNTVVTETPILSGTIAPSSFYPLAGDFTIEEEDGVATLTFASNYEADTRLPGLYVYLSNNTNTNANALEIGSVAVFNGAHSYTLPAGIDINAYQYVFYYCKPFNVPVGQGMIN